jgi:hypothetical protein
MGLGLGLHQPFDVLEEAILLSRPPLKHKELLQEQQNVLKKRLEVIDKQLENL